MANDADKTTILENRRKTAVEVANNYVYEFIISPSDSFLNENTPLLPNMELKLIFDRLAAQFSCTKVLEDEKLKGKVLPLKDVYCTCDYVSSTALRHHYDRLAYEPTMYIYDETMVSCRNLPMNESFIRIENICGGNTPDYLFVGIAKTAALNGSLDLTNGVFKNNNIKEFNITLNGSSVNGYPMKVTNNKPVWAYMRLHDNLSRTANVDLGQQLGLEDFNVSLILSRHLLI